MSQDPFEAFRWYLRSAAMGNAVGQSHVADPYSCGCGVGHSAAQAALWYRRSAAQGFAHAEARLREMAEPGADADPGRAVVRDDGAANQGDSDAERAPSRQ